MRQILAGVALLLAACAGGPRLEPPQHHVLELKPYAGRLRYLELTSPAGVRLLFDSGGGITLLSPATASSAGCVPYTRVSTMRMSGERFEIDACGPATLQFGNLQVRPEIGVFDLSALLPAGMPPVDGLASLQTFEGFWLLLDLGHNRIEVNPSHRGEDMTPVPIRFSRSFAGAGLDAFIRLDGSRGPLWFELDSGNLDEVLLSPRVLDQLGFTPEQRADLLAGSPTKVRLPISGFGPVEATARKADIIYDGVLNAAFFERFMMLFDLADGRGWLRRGDVVLH
jgi:hypothetical protein